METQENGRHEIIETYELSAGEKTGEYYGSLLSVKTGGTNTDITKKKRLLQIRGSMWKRVSIDTDTKDIRLF